MSLREREAGPKGWTSVLAHPFEVATAILFALSAYNLGKAEAEGVDGMALLRLPAPIVWAWVVSLVLGSVLVFGGVLRGPECSLMARTLERAGLWLAMTAWTTLGVAFAFFLGVSQWEGYIQIFVVALGCGLRLRALAKVDHAVRRVRKGLGGDGR